MEPACFAWYTGHPDGVPATLTCHLCGVTVPFGEHPQHVESCPVAAEWRAARDALMRLPEQARADLFSNFCAHCGVDDSGCRCWDDS